MPPADSGARRVCVIGSINMDLVVRAPRFPGVGETILGGSFATFPGGKGANQAVSAARMGARVTMIGRVGDDAHGVVMRDVLAAEGVDVSGVKTTRGVPTGVAVITVAEGGGNTIVVAAGANGEVTPQDVDHASHAIANADVVLIQLEVPVEAVARAAAVARARGKCVMLNAAPARALPRELLSLVDVLIVNESEGGIVSAGASAEYGLDVVRPGHGGEKARSVPPPEEDAATLAMLARLGSLGPTDVIVTFGEAGAAWVQGRRGVMFGACEVTPVDTVGAGDAFCGALAATWPAAGEDDAESTRHDALRIASGAGALATTTSGAIPSLPTLMQVQRFLKQTTR